MYVEQGGMALSERINLEYCNVFLRLKISFKKNVNK
jgi:hypothetical protein